MKFYLMINDAVFNYKSKFDNVNKPFYYVYEKYHKVTKNAENLPMLQTLLFSNKNNNQIFYTGIENKAIELCKNSTKKLKNLKELIKSND